MAELNLDLRLGQTWVIAFASETVMASAAFRMSQDGGDPALDYTTADSPTTITLDSPATSGDVTVTTDWQAFLAPGAWDYEIRAEYADETFEVLQFGKIIAGASLFT